MAQKWKYVDAFAPPAPIIKARLYGQNVNLFVDTGFLGGVLIPFWMFERMGLLSHLAPDEYYAVMADTRKTTLYTATRLLIFGSKKYPVQIHSTPILIRGLQAETS